MKKIEVSNHDKGIYDMNYVLDKERYTIRWRWPKDIDLVYILKATILEDFSVDNIAESNFKLYTKEEYREFNGYRERIKETNQYKYYVFPAVEDEGDVLLLKQNNGKNEIIINIGKSEILYDIKELKSFKSFFSREKILQIIVKSEVDLKKDVLCYVKKQGSYPVNKDDGISFDFINNIPAGTSVMPEITIDKNEYIKVFIKDANKYVNVYSLKQE